MYRNQAVKLVTSDANIIIDIQGGIEDVFALVTCIKMAARTKRKIIGITCCNGRRTVDEAATDALIATKIAGQEIPIYKGARKSILLREKYPDCHCVNNNFETLNAAKEAKLQEEDLAAIQKEPAAVFMAASATKYANTLCIIAFGPTTNVALAYLLNPSIQKLSSIHINGGQSSGTGNVKGVYSAQGNFYYDPHSIRTILLRMGGKIFLNPLEQTLGFNWAPSIKKAVAVKKMQPKVADLLQTLVHQGEAYIGPLLTAFPVFYKCSIKTVYEVYAEVSNGSKMTTGLLQINWLRMMVEPGTQHPNVRIYAEFDTEFLEEELMNCFTD